MTRMFATAVVLAATSFGTPAPAHATAAPGAGLGCSWTGPRDQLSAEPGRMVVYLDGGPVVVTDGATPAAVRLTCTLQVGGAHHTDPDAVSATSPTTLGVAVLQPTVVSAVLPEDEVLYLCSRIDVDAGPAYYWDGEEFEWSTDPGVECTGPTPL